MKINLETEKKNEQQVDKSGMCPFSFMDVKGHGHRLTKTGIMFLSYAVLGVFVSSRGPALLDLAEIVGTDIKTISFPIMIFSTGTFVGSVVAGYILDRFAKFEYFLMTTFVLMLAGTTALLPFCQDLYLMSGVSFVGGFGAGAMSLGNNIICLQIWRGYKDGPFMQFIQLGYSFGAFLGPLIARPFLGEQLDISPDPLPVHNEGFDIIEGIVNITDAGSNSTGTHIPSRITVLFPIEGVIIAIVSLGFAYYAFKEYLIRKDGEDSTKILAQDNVVEETVTKKFKIIIVSLIFIHIFFYVGMEHSYCTYLTTFVVNSDLQLTKQIGATVTSMFFAGFASMRLVASILSVKLSPFYIMSYSLSLCVTGAVCLIIWANNSFLVLQICSVVMGMGMAAIFASALSWTATHFKVNSIIGAIFSTAATCGSNTFIPITGQIVNQEPMNLMYINLGLALGTVLFFFIAVFVSRLKTLKKGGDFKDFENSETESS